MVFAVNAEGLKIKKKKPIKIDQNSLKKIASATSVNANTEYSNKVAVHLSYIVTRDIHVLGLFRSIV